MNQNEKHSEWKENHIIHQSHGVVVIGVGSDKYSVDNIGIMYEQGYDIINYDSSSRKWILVKPRR